MHLGPYSDTIVAMEGRKGFTISARLVAAAVAALVVLSALATSFFSVEE